MSIKTFNHMKPNRIVVISITLSIFACFGWGIADFIGGLKSRNLSTLSILLISSVTGTIVLSLILSFMRSPLPDDPILMWAILAGPVGLMAMYLLYRSLAIGTMSILAPIGATGVILPVIWGVFHGDSVSGLSMVGITIAILGSIMAAMERGIRGNQIKSTKGVGLAVCSAAFVGLYFILMDAACSHNPIWASMIMRASALCVLALLLVFAEVNVNIGMAHFPYIVLMGILDTMAAFCFAIATSKGMLSEVAVISSLYPAVTVILSAVIVKEKIHRIQYSGVVLALIGVMLISSF